MTQHDEPPPRIPMRSGDEQDAFTRWHHIVRWRAGERKRIKRAYSRRLRQVARRMLQEST